MMKYKIIVNFSKLITDESMYLMKALDNNLL